MGTARAAPEAGDWQISVLVRWNAFMPDIENHALAVPIQAVAREIRSLREAIAGGEASLQDDQWLDGWLHAEEGLERAFGTEAKAVVALPPCRERVCG